jgi:hypothetical protein
MFASEMGMRVTVHSGFLLMCGLLATALSIDFVPCAHAKVRESLTSSVRGRGQEKHQPATAQASIQWQSAYSASLPGLQQQTVLKMRVASQLQPAMDRTALYALASRQTTDAGISSSSSAPSQTATVNSKTPAPITDERGEANQTASSGPSSSPLLSNNDGPDHPTLADAPAPQEQTQSAPEPSVSGPQINQLPVLPPRLTSYPLDVYDKRYIYIHEAYGPLAVIFPAFGAGLGMIKPKSTYPEEWKDGAGAFGRRYGDSIARQTSKSTAEFITNTILHEDPRYLRSSSTGALGRTLHALAFTLFDKTDSGKTTPAIAHFAGAAADGFVGMAYLPTGFNDLTHAEQRMVASMGTTAIGSIFTEFEPEWEPIYKKLHIPKILPTWWVPERR